MYKGILFVALLTTSTPVLAQEMSGGIDLKNRYVLGDLFVPTAGPVVQPYASVELGDTGCELGAWASFGLDTKEGNEIDLTASCEFNLAKDTTGKVLVARYLLLNGVADMNEGTVGITHGPVDLSATYYQWKHEDGFRVDAGYSTKIEKIDVRGGLLYETGLDAPDILVGSLSASYPLSENLSLSAEGYIPLVKANNDNRKGQIVFGLTYSF
jgi:hypothetical protein